MSIHKKFFPVGKMPWHDDDHKFGESGKMTWDDVAQKLVPLIEEVEECFKQLEPPPIDEHLKYATYGTIYYVDYGKCYYCKKRAVYGFRGRLYCLECWKFAGGTE